jgi:hypothetical protein
MSREHVLSSCVNAAMGRNLGITLPHLNRRIGADAMKIRVLCETHNSLLSEIDAEAGKLVIAIRRFEATPLTGLRDGARAFDIVPVDGKKFERWALKTFFNLSIWTGCMPAETPSWGVTGDHILGYVFDIAPRPDDCGVFLYPSVGSFEEFKKNAFRLEVQKMKIRIWRHATDELTPEFNCPAFLRLTLFGCEFAVCGNIVPISNVDWRNIMNGLLDHPSKHAQLRPTGWEFGRASATHGPEHYTQLRLQFCWE